MPVYTKSLLISLASFLCFAPQVSASPAADRLLSPDQVHADIDLAAETYRRIHPGYERYTPAKDIEAAWESVKQRAVEDQGLSVADFYLEVERVLTLIRCDHTKAELPRALKAERKADPVYLPLRWQWVEERGIIVIAEAETGLAPGDEILSIDGRPLKDMVSDVRPLIPVDGFANWSADAGVSESLEFMGGAVDHFGALLWDIQPDAELIIERANGQRATLEVARVSFDAWTDLGRDAGRAADFKDAVTFEKIGTNAGYLRVDTFVNYRQPVDPDEIYEPIFKALKTDGRDTLVLDLRQNGGGSSDAQMGLLRHLIETPVAPIRNICARTLNLDGLREHLWTWDKRALKPNRMGFKRTSDGEYCLRTFVDSDLKKKKPAKQAFDGDLIILTSRANSSASTSLIAILKEHRPVTLVGDVAGGSPNGPTAGVQFTLTLPESGIQTRVPFLRYFNNVSGFEDGFGLKPDIQVEETASAVREGRDLALETAKQLVAKKS